MQRQILIIDDHDDLASALDEVFTHTGHSVKVVENRDDALAINDLSKFDLLITDLDVLPGDPASNGTSAFCPEVKPAKGGNEHVRAFKIGAANFRRDQFDENELKDLVISLVIQIFLQWCFSLSV